MWAQLLSKDTLVLIWCNQDHPTLSSLGLQPRTSQQHGTGSQVHQPVHWKAQHQLHSSDQEHYGWVQGQGEWRRPMDGELCESCYFYNANMKFPFIRHVILCQCMRPDMKRSAPSYDIQYHRNNVLPHRALFSWSQWVCCPLIRFQYETPKGVKHTHPLRGYLGLHNRDKVTNILNRNAGVWFTHSSGVPPALCKPTLFVKLSSWLVTRLAIGCCRLPLRSCLFGSGWWLRALECVLAWLDRMHTRC